MFRLFRRRREISKDRFAFGLMIGVTGSAEFDQSFVDFLGSRTPANAHDIRRELYAMRCFGTSLGLYLSLRNQELYYQLSQSLYVLLELLDRTDRASKREETRAAGQEDAHIFRYALQMRHMRLLDELEARDPRQFAIISTQGAALFGFDLVNERTEAYKKSLGGPETGFAPLVQAFATFFSCPSNTEVAAMGIAEFQRYLTLVQTMVVDVRLTESDPLWGAV
jgi:hypothetical protein